MNGRKLRVLQLGKQYYPHIGGIEVTMQQIAEGIQGEVDSFVQHRKEGEHGKKSLTMFRFIMRKAGELLLLCRFP